MLANHNMLAYYNKLLKSLPGDDLASVNSQLVLQLAVQAASEALGKSDPPHAELSPTSLPAAEQLLSVSSVDLLRQQELLDYLRSQLPLTDLTPTSILSPSSSSILPPFTGPSGGGVSTAVDTPCTSGGSCTSSGGGVTTTSSAGLSERGNTRASPDAGSVKEEPRTPSISPKPSFRPVTSKTSPPPSTVQWRTSSNSPPPNKTCNTVSSTTSQHPCDSREGSGTILNLLTGPLVSSAEATRLLSSNDTALTNVTWPATRPPPQLPKKQTYNCYWLSHAHVGPCNRQFPAKDDLYAHLKTHVNDLEALTPATAVLQPLAPPNCAGVGGLSCHDRKTHHAVRFGTAPYQLPGMRCARVSRCACKK